jgi:hypothetical protein
MTPAEAVNLWNTVAPRCGWPTVRQLTSTRVRALQQRLADGGDDYREALAKAEASSFLTGKAERSDQHRNWVLTFDTFIRESFFVRLLEGIYDDRDQKPERFVSDEELRWRSRVDGFRKNGFWMKATWGPAPGEPGCLCPSRYLTH